MGGIEGVVDLLLLALHVIEKGIAGTGSGFQRAVALGEKVAEGRGQVFKDVAIFGREGLGGERPRGQNGIHALVCDKAEAWLDWLAAAPPSLTATPRASRRHLAVRTAGAGSRAR